MPRKVLIVGGGDGGTILANRLAKRLSEDEAEITVIDKSDLHWYQPGFLFVAVGEASKEDITKPRARLYRKGIRFVWDEVTRIDLDDRKIELKKGGSKTYDYLVVATGSIQDYSYIPGFREAVYHMWTFEDAQKLYSQLMKFGGGKLIVGVGGLTYKCPVAPLEIAFLADEFLRIRGVREKTEIKYVSPLDRPYPPRLLNKIMMENMKERDIEPITYFTVDEIDPEKKEVRSMEGESLKYDLLILTPPHRGAEVVISSGIGDDDGWIPVDKYFLNIKGYDDAFAIGDATALPTPKTGVVAHFQAATVSDNIAYEIKGLSKRTMFDGQSFCLIEMGRGVASAQVSNYHYKDAPGLIPSRILHLAKLAMNKIYWTCILSGNI